MSAVCDVALIGCSAAHLFAARKLAREGLRCLLVELPPELQPPELAREVLWPGFPEHWGRIYEALGAAACSRWMRLVARSHELLKSCFPWSDAAPLGGAVLQLAAHPAEWADLCAELGWVAERSPRRLMSAGAASNLVTVGEAAGAAFVAGSASFDPERLRRGLRRELEAAGCGLARLLSLDLSSGAEATVRTDTGVWSAEVVSLSAGTRSLELAGSQGSWLQPLTTVELSCEPRAADWNAALSALEAHRGHLAVVPHGARWLLRGVAPDGGSAHATAAAVERLAAELLLPLSGVEWQAQTSPVWLETPDRLPAVGPLPGSRCWLLEGWGSREWTLGPALGEAAADALLGQPTLLSQLPEARPSRFARR